VFAQRANLARPAFRRMLADLLRFNRLTTALARDGTAAGPAASES
jgi:predicted NAD/FAD-binding protein